MHLILRYAGQVSSMTDSPSPRDGDDGAIPVGSYIKHTLKELKMNFEITYAYSPEFSKIVSRQFLMLRNGWSSILLWGLLSIGGLITSFSSSPSYHWIGGYLIAFVINYILQLVRYVQSAEKSVKELPNKSITIKFNDENVTSQSEDHMSISKWKRFSQVWITKDAWLFFLYSTDSYSAIPTNYIGEELESFILSKFSKDRIRDYRRQK